MKATAILSTLLLAATLTFAQKGFKIGVSATSYSTPKYENAVSEFGFACDMSYFFTETLFVGTHVNFGKFKYHVDVFNGLTDGNVGTNSTAQALHAGILLGCNIRLNTIFRLYGATGISGLNEENKFPVYSALPEIEYQNATISEIAAPVRVGIEARLLKGFSIGFISGFYYMPDNPFTGVHYGLSLSQHFFTSSKSGKRTYRVR